MIESKILRKRLIAAFCDMAIILEYLVLSIFISVFVFKVEASVVMTRFNPILISFLVIMSKDLVFSRSFGKRLFGLKVQQKKGGRYDPIRLLIRNVTLIVGVIEIPYLIQNKERLGDKLASTEVVNNYDELTDLKKALIVIPIVLIPICIFAIGLVSRGVI